MRITDIKAWPVAANWRTIVYLKVLTDEGIEGLGEATIERNTREVLASIESFREMLVGENPLNITCLWQRMFAHPIWFVGASTMTAIGGIEIALWDILGKALNVPVYQLLGGKVRDKIRAYANGWFHGCTTIGQFAEAAARTVHQDGYQALMWDPFGGVDLEMNALEMRKAIECVREVRNAIGPHVDMPIEFHFKFGVAAAIRLCKALEEFNPYWYEDPLRVSWYNTDAWRNLARATSVPLTEGGALLGRFGYRRIIEEQLVQHLKTDILHSGGLAETARVAAWAETYGITCSPHSVGGVINQAAVLHFAAATPNFLMFEHLPPRTEPPAVTDVSSRPLPEVKNGYLDIPDGPGLGVDLDNVEDIARRFPCRLEEDAPKLARRPFAVSTIHPFADGEREFLDSAPPFEWRIDYS